MPSLIPENPKGMQLSETTSLLGVIKHACNFTAVTNPTVNKRLVPGYEAPVYIAWSESQPFPDWYVCQHRGMGTRLELRS